MPNWECERCDYNINNLKKEKMESKYFEIFLVNWKVLKIFWEIIFENNSLVKIKEEKTNKIYRIKEYININEFDKKTWNNLYENLEKF